MQSLENATEISFWDVRDWNSRKCLVRVTRRDEVQRLVSLLPGERWGDQRPGCEHILLAVFKTPAGNVEIDFCMACFGGEHQMPKEFYAAFEKLRGKHES